MSAPIEMFMCIYVDVHNWCRDAKSMEGVCVCVCVWRGGGLIDLLGLAILIVAWSVAPSTALMQG